MANLPEDDFNAAVDSDNPPTVTELANRGRAFVQHRGAGYQDPCTLRDTKS